MRAQAVIEEQRKSKHSPLSRHPRDVSNLWFWCIYFSFSVKMLLILTANTNYDKYHKICDFFVAAKLTVGAEITAVGPSAKKRKTEEDCYTLTVKHCCCFFP